MIYGRKSPIRVVEVFLSLQTITLSFQVNFGQKLNFLKECMYFKSFYTMALESIHYYYYYGK